MGLKPVVKHECPGCDFKLKYFFRDPDIAPHKWVLSTESLHHLNTAHASNVISINRRRSQPRFRKTIRPVRKVS